MPNDKIANKHTSSTYTAKSELERLLSVLGNLSRDAKITKALPVNEPIDDDSPVPDCLTQMPQKQTERRKE
jgi:hypothetical protein